MIGILQSRFIHMLLHPYSSKKWDLDKENKYMSAPIVKFRIISHFLVIGRPMGSSYMGSGLCSGT